jgi:hypothetical protein
MSIAVSVLTSRLARNNVGAARQESNPQAATTYISERYRQVFRTAIKTIFVS